MGQRIRFTPFHAAGGLFLLAGLVLAAYHGLEQFGIAPAVAWVAWSHVHYVTVGAFTQLLLGTVPQFAARRLDRPVPSARFTWSTFAGVNGGFLALWFGRAFGSVPAFDLGVSAVFLTVLGLLVALLRMALSSSDGWDATVALYLLSPFVFLWGIVYGYGLWGHVWSVPGGWYGLREAHVHANAWGFLAFAAIGSMYVLFPRLAGADLRGERLRDASVPLLATGIFPLIVGPWLGRGRTVTAAGLVLYGTGYLLYVAALVRTYRAGTRSGLTLGLLVSQFWLLAPAAFAPFVLFGVEWVPPAAIEQGALHFLFVGWALPLAFAGLLLSVRPSPGDGPGEEMSGIPLTATSAPPVPKALVAAWNLAVLAVGVGFVSQEAAWSVLLFGVGYAVLGALWLAALLGAASVGWSTWAATRSEV